ncbi:hypothetical protein GOP47_0022429 [Adiantum capillus-veneris]|uniref:Uncharacterized protein n=1 Tax=Adiantum capillus-veneris TaxID=13818 RepID=A0A9D4U6B0_ADICA|nr:hypothetical protein GOP47_0022429 [Adiantum capillus-veneris]
MKTQLLKQLHRSSRLHNKIHLPHHSNHMYFLLVFQGCNIIGERDANPLLLVGPLEGSNLMLI